MNAPEMTNDDPVEAAVLERARVRTSVTRGRATGCGRIRLR